MATMGAEPHRAFQGVAFAFLILSWVRVGWNFIRAQPNSGSWSLVMDREGARSPDGQP